MSDTSPIDGSANFNTPLSSVHFEDVAIIGMSVRAAGNITTPEKLWQSLLDQTDNSSITPKKRWEPWYRRDVRNAKEIDIAINRGYFVEDLEMFDAAFFGISPKEAEQMDPHQRLGLELAWEALENAGVDPKMLAKSDTAVYMGVDSDDYSRLILEDIPNIEAHCGIGSTAHGIPNRISYHLDLMGPSAAVDAACASSLVAVHMGFQAIKTGESQIAIVGGVNVLCSPALFVMLSKAGALSPDGVCRSFADDANGYARGEGGAVLILKRLSDAIADHDNILSVLKGSAVAQDGKTNGIMAPNANAQQLVARKALERANVDPLTVNFIEAHATATPLGDPTEVSAIAAVYGQGRPISSPAHLGSIKPNVGHLEAAAGAISLIKAVLSVNKGELAPQMKLNKLNSRIDWENSGLKVIREHAKWTEPEGVLRRAAICSYGYGGTVSHTIIEEFPKRQVGWEIVTMAVPVTLVLSAPQEKRLALYATALADWLSEAGREEELNSIAATLALRRAPQDYRVSFVVSNHDEAVKALRAFAKGSSSDLIADSRVFGNDIKTEAVWVFSGHGAQWPNMGKELLLNPVFKDAILPLDPIIEQEVGYSAIKVLETGDFEDSDVVQVLTYVVQIGISEVLKSKGVFPEAVIGHSVGEIAASVVAGCLTPKEGALVVTRRAKLYAQVKGQGGMALVNLKFSDVAVELKGKRDIVAAIDTSPSSCLVSGEAGVLAEYVENLKTRNIKTFKVNTDIAFHSPMLGKLVDPLSEALSETLDPQPPVVQLYSTSTADPRADSLRNINYWINNMTGPVWLSSAVVAAIEDGFRVFLEVSTHPIVTNSINEALTDFDEAVSIGIMKKNTSAEKSIQHAIAQLWVKGSYVNFKAQFGRNWSSAVPGAPWSQKPYWREVDTGPIGEGIQHDVDKHTLLGQRIPIAGSDTVLYTTKLDDKTKPYPGMHPLDGTEIIPAAVYVNTYHHATSATVLENILLRVPVSMVSDRREVQIVIQADTISVLSRLESKSDTSDELEHNWVSHSSANWSAPSTAEYDQTFDISKIQKRIGTILPNSFSWEYLKKIGVSGIAFPWAVVEHYGNEKEMMVRVDMDPEAESLPWDEYSWGPLLDAATSIGSTIFFIEPKIRIVSQIDKVLLLSNEPRPKIAYLFVENVTDNKSPACHISVLSEQGQMLAKFHAMRLLEVEGASGSSGAIESAVHQIAWIPAKLSEKPFVISHVVLVSEDSGVLKQFSHQLKTKVPLVTQMKSAQELGDSEVLSSLKKGSIIVYIPGQVETVEDVPAATHKFVWETVSLIKLLAISEAPAKLFVITDPVHQGGTPTALAHGALYSLGRIAATEHPDIWGALIDNEGPQFPIMVIKYVRDQDIIRVDDGVAKVARLRPFSRDQRNDASSTKTLLPKSEGTYVVTGGFGDLGVEILDFLVEKGARRIIVLSRTALPARKDWAAATGKTATAVKKVQQLENIGASIHSLALDIGAEDADLRLLAALDRLSLPPVMGVVHAAGIMENNLILNTSPEDFARVLKPKVSGSLALHKAFPPGTVDFFVLFSSTGGLFGTSGQSPYGTSNAFLDALAIYRRAQGDNAIAFQFTAWRGLGMGADTGDNFLNIELENQGITDITRDEGFRAWEHVSKYNTDHSVVTRIRGYDVGAPVPNPLVEEVAPRRTISSAPGSKPENKIDSRPTSGPELKTWLNIKIRESLAAVMMIGDIEDIDSRAAVSDLGVDSVMMIPLRQKLQTTIGLKVSPTLIWNHPTVAHIVELFYGKLTKSGDSDS